MAYKVKLNIFEGPFDLLVYLIENAEMSIYDIRISEITAQYLKYVRLMKEQNVMAYADFLVLAATLIEIKSRMLLPHITPEGEELPPGTDLTQKLVEYMRFKRRAAALEELMDAASLKFIKPQEDLTPWTGEPDEYLNLEMDKFIDAFKAFIYKRRKNEEIRRMRDRIEREKVSVATKKTFIERVLAGAKGGFAKFRDFLSPRAGRYDKVVTFVSLLEMVRSGAVRVRQDGNFHEIEVQRLKP
ncbi:MAG: segregation/condensation protein A [Clostridiales Family XIII bacterium]|jgi:segregation and condensation protein A|nr:segregation/condensation protein A [Clostridiales Family XIII bacterium]